MLELMFLTPQKILCLRASLLANEKEILLLVAGDVTTIPNNMLVVLLVADTDIIIPNGFLLLPLPR